MNVAAKRNTNDMLMKLTTTNFARFVFAQLARMVITEKVEVISEDSARVALKNGQQFTVVVISGKPKRKAEPPSGQ